MKKYVVYLIVLLFLVSCYDSPKQHSCRLYVYYGCQRVYQIVFNGRDSLVTYCGKLSLDSLRLRGLKGTLGDKKFKLSPVYMKRTRKLESEQAYLLISIISRLDSKVITDTVKGEIKDVRDVFLSLDRKNVHLQMSGIKDSDIQMLVDSLIEYSPLLILDASDWWGLKNEEELIRQYDKRKK